MLKIVVPGHEYFDESSDMFVEQDEIQLCLEHSLVSLSKWESKFEKPFLSSDEKTDEEIREYVVMMSSDENLARSAIGRLTEENVEQIQNHIHAKMTATWFRETKAPPSREVITAEIIYYWMVTLNIPFECQHWHLNKLLTLVKVCNQKNQPPKKMGKSELLARNRELNAARRKQLGTKG